MVLVCHVIPQEHEIKGFMGLYEWKPFMVSLYPAKFVGYRHWGSENSMFLVIEEQDSTNSIKSTITIYL